MPNPCGGHDLKLALAPRRENSVEALRRGFVSSFPLDAVPIRRVLPAHDTGCAMMGMLQKRVRRNSLYVKWLTGFAWLLTSTSSAQIHGPGDFVWNRPANPFAIACQAVSDIGLSLARFLPYDRLVMTTEQMITRWHSEMSIQPLSWNRRVEGLERELTQRTDRLEATWNALTPPLRNLCSSHSQEFFQQLYRDCFLTALQSGLVTAATRVAPQGPITGARLAQANLSRALIGRAPVAGLEMHAQLRNIHWSGLGKLDQRFSVGDLSHGNRSAWRNRLQAVFERAFGILDRGLKGVSAETCNSDASRVEGFAGVDIFEESSDAPLIAEAAPAGNPFSNRLTECSREHDPAIGLAYWSRLSQDPAFPFVLAENWQNAGDLQGQWALAAVAAGLRLGLGAIGLGAEVAPAVLPTGAGNVVPYSEFARRLAAREAARLAARQSAARQAVAEQSSGPRVAGLFVGSQPVSTFDSERRPVRGDSDRSGLFQLLGEVSVSHGESAFLVAAPGARVCHIPRTRFCQAVAQAPNRSANDVVCDTAP